MWHMVSVHNHSWLNKSVCLLLLVFHLHYKLLATTSICFTLFCSIYIVSVVGFCISSLKKLIFSKNFRLSVFLRITVIYKSKKSYFVVTSVFNSSFILVGKFSISLLSFFFILSKTVLSCIQLRLFSLLCWFIIPLYFDYLK